MRLLSMQKNVAMWNECFTEHAKNKTCTSPHFEVHDERQGNVNKSCYMKVQNFFALIIFNEI